VSIKIPDSEILKNRRKINIFIIGNATSEIRRKNLQAILLLEYHEQNWLTYTGTKH
jgi:hypothetical protein